MPMKDMVFSSGVRLALKPTPHSTGVIGIEGEVVDILGFNALTFLVTSIYGTDTATLYTPSVLHSDDDITYEAAPKDTVILDTAGIQSSAASIKVGYTGFKRYVKLVLTPSAAASAANTLFAHAVLQHANVAPAS